MEVEDYASLSDSTVWHAAQGGNPKAAAELRKREHKHRVAGLSPEVKALMASRLRNGRPS